MKAKEIDDLIGRLEARCSYGDARLWQKHDPLSEEAALAITKLEARCAELEEARAKQWRLRREAEGSRDAARAAADTLRAELNALRTSQDGGEPTNG